MNIEPRFTVRVGDPHPATVEVLRVLARILVRRAMDSSARSSLHVSEAGDVEPAENHDEANGTLRAKVDRPAGAVAR